MYQYVPGGMNGQGMLLLREIGKMLVGGGGVVYWLWSKHVRTVVVLCSSTIILLLLSVCKTNGCKYDDDDGDDDGTSYDGNLSSVRVQRCNVSKAPQKCCRCVLNL